MLVITQLKQSVRPNNTIEILRFLSVECGFFRGSRLIHRYRDRIKRVAKAVLERETLRADEIDALIA